MAKKKVKAKEVADEDAMPQPDQMMQDLSGRSNDNGQSIDEWIEWLEFLQDEVKHWLTMARHDRDKQEQQEAD